MEQIQEHQPVTSQYPPVTPQPSEQIPVIQPSSKRSFDLRYLFLLLLIIGLGGVFLTLKKPEESVPSPTISATPTSTPKLKPVIPIATQSSYLELTQGVASLSASITQLQVSDTTLIPPTIELPLGFPNE